MELTAENSRRLSNVSFLCACVVVLIHVPWPRETVWQQYLAVGLRNLLVGFITPLFSAIAGFLLAGRIGEPGWWRKAVAKRARTLLVPYVAWMGIATVVLWICSGALPVDFANSGLNLCRQPLVVPLWFIRALFLFVAASPLIHLGLVRWGWRLLLFEYLMALGLTVALSLGLLAETEGLGGLLYYGISLEGLFYFSLGIWIRSRPSPCIGRKTSLACLFIATAAVAVVLVLRRFGISVPVNVPNLAAPLFLIGIWRVTPTAAWPHFLVGSSFAIYVSHAVVLGAIWFSPSLKGICPFWLTVLLGIVIPIVLVNLLSRFTPRLARILYGGRT